MTAVLWGFDTGRYQAGYLSLRTYLSQAPAIKC